MEALGSGPTQLRPLITLTNIKFALAVSISVCGRCLERFGKRSLQHVVGMLALAWLLPLASLLLHPSRGDPALVPGGEWCRVWASPGWVFQCPQRSNKPDAQFCCGNCSLPYCCSSKARRLDQQRCPRPVVPGVPDPRNNPPPSDLVSYKWTIFFSFASFLMGVLLLLSVRHCKERYWPRLRNFWEDNVVPAWNRRQEEATEVVQMGVYYVPDNPDPLPRPPPPNVTILPRNLDNPHEKWAFSPSALVEFFQPANAESAEGEGAFGSLFHRHVPSQASDTPSEKESSV
ncbi:protein shisa-9-like [Anolis carolinensis]|uniref:protein shisa-9-like n=1 Tax=Anolis carolinensis TaxID=28377 RepID=UPI002F2B6B09